MAKTPNEHGVVEFKNDGIIFTFGAPFGNIRVKECEEEIFADILKDKSFVICVKIEEKNSEGKWVVKTEFDPTFSLEVKYDQDDLTTLQNIQEEDLVLYFCGVEEREWKKFDSSHGYDKPEKKKEGRWLGFGLAAGISEWPDPLIAWGG